MRYADVIVDLSAENADRPFTYTVPDGMSVLPGMMVAVPFRASERHGFVLGVSERPPEKMPRRDYKPVLRVLEDACSLLPEQIELAHWMRGRCACTLSDALRLMTVPGILKEKIRSRTQRIAQVQDPARAREYLRAHARAAKQAEILRALEAGPAPAALFPSALLRQLVQAGIVSIAEEQVRRVPGALSRLGAGRDPELTAAQRTVFEKIRVGRPGARYLLHGVTGSGKTEIYIRVIRSVLEQGKSAIVLVPEIALTPQLAGWFSARFGDTAAILHSALSDGERRDEWIRIRTGEARVVVGARSAVFAPAEDIGAVIVDEEHESSYQSDHRPRYDAREVAWRRAEASGAILIYGSATPSVQTYMRAMPGVREENRLTLLEMPQRANGRPLPEATVVDMRREYAMGNTGVFSSVLRGELKDCIDGGRQALLFLNRRGFSSFVSCRSCGKAIRCANCDVTMTYHLAENRLICHYCGDEIELPPKCPNCSSRALRHFGIGTEKVEKELKEIFPGIPVLRMDADTTRTKDAHRRIYERFRSGEAQVLVGTQMIAKGLDFPGVSLVGVLNADLSLDLPDYRSPERTFQLITQAVGRAGRAERDGKAIIQTYDPEHYAVALAAKQDYRAFYIRESRYRRLALYPPFTTILRIVFSSADAEKAQECAQKAEGEMAAWFEQSGQQRDVIQARALEAPIGLLRGESRWQLFVKVHFKGDIDGISEKMQEIADRAETGVRSDLEINPNNLL